MLSCSNALEFSAFLQAGCFLSVDVLLCRNETADRDDRNMIQMATQISFLGLSGKKYFVLTEVFPQEQHSRSDGREIVANAAGKNLENPAGESSRVELSVE